MAAVSQATTAPVVQRAMAPAIPPSRRRAAAVAALLGFGVLAAYLLVVPGAVPGLDGQSMYQVTRSMVERHDVTVWGGSLYGVSGLHGRVYSKYGPAQSVLAIPLYLLGRALQGAVPAYFRPELPGMAASALPALVTALTAALVLLTAVELGATTLGGAVLALVYALTSPAAVYTTQWFSEPLAACTLLAAVYLLVRDRSDATLWRPLLAGVALGIGVATRVEGVLFIPFLALYTLVPARRRAARLLAVAGPLALTALGLAVYNAVRFGSPLQTGYSGGNAYAERDTHPPHTLASLLEGLYGLLISPGKGLLEYAPASLLAPLGVAALWARRRAETLLLLGLILVDLVAHANVLIRWLGGWSWGPRFLMPVLPLVLLLLAPLLGPWGGTRRGVRRTLAVLAILGLLVQAPALVVMEPHIYIYTLVPRYQAAHPGHPMTATTLMERDYTNRPDLSPIVGAWQQLGRAATWTPPPDVSPRLIAGKSLFFEPHTWWRLLSLQGVPAPPLAVACALLAMLALSCIGGAVRLAGTSTRLPA